MSAPNKAVARRRGYRKAIDDVESEVCRLVTAISFVKDAGRVVDTPELRGAMQALSRIRVDVLNPLRRRARIE